MELSVSQIIAPELAGLARSPSVALYRACRRSALLLAVRIIRYPGKYRVKYLSFIDRGKSKKMILIAIARKLSMLVYTLLTRAEPFDPALT